MSQATPPATTHRVSYSRPQLLKAVSAGVDTSKMTSRAVLSFPVEDIAGDYVEPSGLDWTLHKSQPFIDLEHSRTPDVKSHPVAWARGSLSKPGAPYAVEYVNLNCAGEGEAPEFHSLPVGTNYFDPSDRISTQVFSLVEQDILPGVSLEFLPVANCFKAIGRTTLERRPSLPDPGAAYHFTKARVVRWTICQSPVNGGALSILKSATPGKSSSTQVPATAGKILRDNRVNVAGKWEPLHDYIRKALMQAGAESPKRTIVRVEKAMNPDEVDATLDTANAAVVEDALPPDDGGPAHNGVTALYNHAQAIADACDQLESDLETTDSAELFREGKKMCEMARALAEKVKASGDKHDAKLQAMKGGKEEEPEAEGEAEEAEKPADMEEDEDGTFKAVRRVYQPILKAARAKRFRMADLSHAEGAEVKKATGEPELTPEQEAELEKRLARAERRLKYVS
jgi:hypothetical protein